MNETSTRFGDPSPRSSAATYCTSRSQLRSMATFVAFGPCQRLLSDCVAGALEAEGLEVERPIPSADGDLRGLVLAAEPAVFLVDGVSFDSSGGAELVDRVHERGGTVVVVAPDGTRENSTNRAGLGADGVVSAAEGLGALVSAVRRAMGAGEGETARGRSGESAAHGPSPESPRDRERLASLSPRERVVLDGIMDGLSAPEIADEQFVAVSTVRSQIRSVLCKLEVNSQLAAVAVAHRAGWNMSIRHNHQF